MRGYHHLFGGRNKSFKQAYQAGIQERRQGAAWPAKAG